MQTKKGLRYEGPPSMKLGQDKACRQKGLEVHVGLQEASGLGSRSGKGTRGQHSDQTPDLATGSQRPAVSRQAEPLWG